MMKQASCRTASLCAALMFLGLVIYTIPVSAATSGGLGVSPAIESIALNQGQSTSSFNETVTNSTNATLVVDIAARDFTTLGNSGSLQFLNSTTVLHGLSKVLQFSPSVITIGPNSSRQIVITVGREDQLSPGGHYAAITFAVENGGTAIRPNQISAHEVLSSLVFLSTYGNTTQTVRLQSAPWPWLQVAVVPSINLAIANTGNVQTVPRGLVTITSWRRAEVARGIVNVGSGLVLPNSNRLYEVPLRMEGRVYPGVYHLKVIYGAGQNAETTYTKTFIVLTGPVLGVIVVVLLLDGMWLIRRKGTQLQSVFRIPGRRAK